MRTSLNETEQLENWLFKQGDSQNLLLTEAKTIMQPALLEKAHWQSTSYRLIRQYGREQLTAEIKAVEDELFYSKKYTSFQNRIKSIFR